MNSTLHQLVLHNTALFFDIPEAKAGEAREGRTWTRKQELGHLIDSAMNNHNRIVRAALHGEYTGPFYDADGWVDINAYAELPWVTVITLWRDLNVQLARVIARIPENWLSSPCHIGDNPPATLEWLIADYSAHMQHHLSKILAQG